MNAWALHRKRIILLIVFAALVVLVGVPLYFFLRPSPSCFDHRQDGDEQGVDCGGSCSLLCTDESLPAIVVGDPRVLALSPTSYEVVVIIENPNVSASIYRAPFTVDVFGSSTVPVQVIHDATYIPPHASFALFFGPLTASSTPGRASFAWDAGGLVWTVDHTAPPGLSFSDQALTVATSSTRLQATVQNDSLQPLADIELVALLSDASDNVVAAGKTLVESLPGQASAPVVFSWPFAVASSTSIRILPRVLPDPSFIR